jgi:hypothetical protein
MDNRVYLGYLADLVVAIHLAYIAYVLIGQVSIFVGMALRWAWIRVPWFRISHLVMIWIVAIEALFDVVCPLTTWEIQLRAAANQPYSERTFVGRCLDRILFLNEDTVIAQQAAKEKANQEAEKARTDEPTTTEETSIASEKAPSGPQQETVDLPEESDLTWWYVGFAIVTTITFVLAPPRRRRPAKLKPEPVKEPVIQQDGALTK